MHLGVQVVAMMQNDFGHQTCVMGETKRQFGPHQGGKNSREKFLKPALQRKNPRKQLSDAVQMRSCDSSLLSSLVQTVVCLHAFGGPEFQG